jgi:uncharacterized membrane protein
VDGLVADYSGHFEEGLAAGRDELQIARALGDPQSLAEQLRLEVEVAAWESSRSPRTGWRVVNASFRRFASTLTNAVLGALAVMLLAMAVLATLGLVATGLWMAVAGPSLELPGGTPSAALVAAGLIAAGVSIGATAALGVLWTINRLAARTRQRLLAQIRTGKSA